MAQTDGITNSKNHAMIEIPQEPTNDIGLFHVLSKIALIIRLVWGNDLLTHLGCTLTRR